MSTQNSKQSVASLRAALFEARVVVEQLERDLREAEEAAATAAVVAMVERDGPSEPTPFFGLEFTIGPSDATAKVPIPGIDSCGEFRGSCSGYLRGYPDASMCSGVRWSAFLYYEGAGMGYLGDGCYADAAALLRRAYAEFLSRLAIAA